MFKHFFDFILQSLFLVRYKIINEITISNYTGHTKIQLTKKCTLTNVKYLLTFELVDYIKLPKKYLDQYNECTSITQTFDTYTKPDFTTHYDVLQYIMKCPDLLPLYEELNNRMMLYYCSITKPISSSVKSVGNLTKVGTLLNYDQLIDSKKSESNDD